MKTPLPFLCYRFAVCSPIVLLLIEHQPIYLVIVPVKMLKGKGLLRYVDIIPKLIFFKLVFDHSRILKSRPRGCRNCRSSDVHFCHVDSPRVFSGIHPCEVPGSWLPYPNLCPICLLIIFPLTDDCP